MSAIKYFARAFQSLKSITFRSKTKKGNDFINELIHPRFEVSEHDVTTQKKVVNSLLFLMYSKENEPLFL